jgi:hypothetical protein
MVAESSRRRAQPVVAFDLAGSVGQDESGAGPGLMLVFTERDISDVVDLVFDQPLCSCPFVQVSGLSLGGGQGGDQVGGLAAGLAVDGAGAGDADGLLGVGERDPAPGCAG